VGGVRGGAEACLLRRPQRNVSSECWVPLITVHESTSRLVNRILEMGLSAGYCRQLATALVVAAP